MLSIKPSKYLKVEIIFFITYFYLFRLLTNLEYNFWEERTAGISVFDAEFSLAYGTSDLISFWVFYELVKRYLTNGRLVVFIGNVLLFLVVYAFFRKGASYLFAHLEFFSPKMRQWSMIAFKAKSFGYSLAYMFRELLSISFLAYFIHFTEQKEKMKILKEQQLMSELSYLKAQLHPHFFFNTLNNIYSLALDQSKATAPLVAKLADMMRYILYKSQEQFVSLKEEVTFLLNYVEVEKVRYRADITINFETQGIDEVSKIGPLLLLPFIENAFKHGVQEETEQGFVTIVICKTEEELMLEVSNSIPHKVSVEPIGIGLINVQKRLTLLYPEKHTLVIDHTIDYFSVCLSVKL
jgi:sensor histidine kinase YesM